MSIGAMIYGAVSIAAGLYRTDEGVSTAAAVFNTGMLLSGLYNILAVADLFQPDRKKLAKTRNGRMLFAFTLASALLAVLFITAVSQYPPGFFQEGGSAVLQQVILIAAVLEFFMTAIFLLLVSSRSHSAFLSYYAQAMALNAVGLVGLLSTGNADSILGWASRGALHLGYLYLLVSVIKMVYASGRFAIPLDSLHETYNRYTSLADSNPDAILVLTGDTCVFANPAAAALFGTRTKQDLIGKAIAHLIRGGSLQAFDTAKEKELPLSETRLTRLDGNTIDIETVGVRVEYEGIPSIQLILRDITERKRTEAELRIAMAHADAANRAKSEFLAHMSHELRTPISGIVGMIDILSSRIPGEENLSYLELVKESAQSLLAIVGDVLDLSRIESGIEESTPTACRIGHEIESIIPPFRLMAEKKGLSLALEIDGSLPRIISADIDKVTRVLRNFISNAIKYTERGGITVTARCERNEEGKLLFSCLVRDTGIGIPGDRLDAVFERFYRIQTSVTTKKPEGSGLGLTISKRLVELMHGSITVTSMADEGSAFGFTIETEELEDVLFESPRENRKTLRNCRPYRFSSLRITG